MNHRIRKPSKWTAEQRAQHQAIRDTFQDWHPGPEELIASGAAARLGLDVIHSPAQDMLEYLKASREAAALSLAEVSARSGIDGTVLSSLENGEMPNPSLDTLWRYAAAVGKRLILSTEDIQDTRLGKPTAGRRLPKYTTARKKRTRA